MNTTNKKVISKNTKGNKTNKDNILKKLLKEHKIISIIISCLILFIVLFIIIMNISIDYKVVTINNKEYTKNDFNIYLYSAKYNYFGNVENITKDDLKVIINDETNMTVSEYLKNTALNDIKTAAAINSLANDYNIFLDDEDYKELDNEKEKFIESIGGNKEFKKMLKDNESSETAYDKMSETDKLYKKILKKLYSEGKINDLTEEELVSAKETYKSNYVKIKQIILTIIDLNTGKSLTSTTINQKETLASKIVEEAKTGIEFDKLISKYSEDAIDKEPPYETYYKKGELLSELDEIAFNLTPGEISKVIKTKYAYHIIQKLELDNFKLEEYYDDLREEKCINDLKEYLDELKLIYHDAYEKIEVK